MGNSKHDYSGSKKIIRLSRLSGKRKIPKKMKLGLYEKRKKRITGETAIC